MRLLIVGTGNVASHLVQRCYSAGISVSVQGRSDETTQLFAEKYGVPYFGELESPKNQDLILLCVSDSALERLLPYYAQFAPTATVSGGFSIAGIESKYPVGVCYPLQTFSAASEVNWKNIPFFVESSNPEFAQQLVELGNKLGKEAHQLSAADRIKLHITAVFANNFVNHLNIVAKEFAENNNLDFSWFSGLIEETQRKISNGTFVDQQTGPAKRGDFSTIEQHLALLPDNLKKIYSAITNDILTHKKTDDQL